MKFLTLCFPFIASILLIGISPVICAKIKSFELKYYEVKFTELGLADHTDAETSEKSIAEFSLYMVDAYQMATLTLVPVIGVVIAFADIGLSLWAALAYIGMAFVGVFGFIRMLSGDPDPEHYFRGTRWRRGIYSPVAVWGVLANIGALVAVTCIYFFVK
ncbi:hypothetical protein J7F03_20425 [Streptomyces sp. ISL-43]|uniref:hypothetical protein n=1 Tax=Streptomyces sp. ISL-43 TaxID=2819183 RepID=UPI001BEA1F4D|nr:hypothetical protein [Streptomyces sp. ISL-43]MBT2449414.1 hypothetical protein [Streptomyces sp. ISL-43]